MQQLAEWVRTPQPLTEQFIGALHATLLGVPQPAASPYKTTPNNVLTATAKPCIATLPQDVPARLADLLAGTAAKPRTPPASTRWPWPPSCTTALPASGPLKWATAAWRACS